jgi:hypothetical protein
MGVFTQDTQSAAPGDPKSALIANAASLSGVIDLGDQRLHRIHLPSAWTAAAITFQTSSDGVAFADLYDKDGEITLPSSVVAASRSVVVPQEAFYGIRYLKIRSGTGASAVTQGADRSLALVTVPR